MGSHEPMSLQWKCPTGRGLGQRARKRTNAQALQIGTVII